MVKVGDNFTDHREHLMTPEHGLLDWGIVAIFVTVYAGMILGGLPRLKLDRSGVALLGAPLA